MVWRNNWHGRKCTRYLHGDGMTDEKRVKTTRETAAKFEKEFKKYQKLFGLTGWDVSFIVAPIVNSRATVHYAGSDCIATVTLNDTQAVHESSVSEIKELAKHEAIHLLLARYDFIASARYIDSEELSFANEEITVKLTDIIP